MNSYEKIVDGGPALPLKRLTLIFIPVITQSCLLASLTTQIVKGLKRGLIKDLKWCQWPPVGCCQYRR